jgi:predicted amidohydrolase YtcJ
MSDKYLPRPAGLLSADYFSVPEDSIKDLQSVLTLVGGKVV